MSYFCYEADCIVVYDVACASADMEKNVKRLQNVEGRAIANSLTNGSVTVSVYVDDVRHYDNFSNFVIFRIISASGFRLRRLF